MKAVLQRVAWAVVEGLSVLACWSMGKSLGICVPHTPFKFLSTWLLLPWQPELSALGLFLH